jgi:hypothetical protein
MIDAFVTRTANFDRAMMVSVRKFNLPFVEVREDIHIDELVRECVDKIGVLI